MDRKDLPVQVIEMLDRFATTLLKAQAESEKAKQLHLYRRAAATLVFAYWQAKFNHPRALLDRMRELKIMARLEENHEDVSELLYALDGAFTDPWTRGTDPRADRAYDGIDLILRDRKHIEKFAERRKGYRQDKPHPAFVKYLNPQGAIDGTPSKDAGTGQGTLALEAGSADD